MNRRDPDTPDAPARAGGGLVTSLVVVLLAVAALQVVLTVGLSRRIGAMETASSGAPRDAAPPSRAPSPAPTEHGASASADEKLDALRSELDLLINDVQRIERKMDDLTTQLENRGEVRAEPAQPPDLDWTEPALFEAARKGADSCGFTLTKDELRVPARLVLREGLVEYFAVLKGGKEHETVFSIVGNVPPDARRPKDMGVKLSNAIQALGVPRGTPIRFGPLGTQPAQGRTLHVYCEWTTGGKSEVVRTEDLVWHREENRAMKPGSWVFVGSHFIEGEQPGELTFVADLTAEAMATYSSPGTIVDNVDASAQDDTMFLVATPRIPADVDHCTLVFRKEPLAAVKEFPPIGTDSGEQRDR